MSNNDEKIAVFEYLYRESKDAFLDEWRRKQSLETKANVYLSIYAIILGLGFVKIETMVQLVKEAAYKSPKICWVIILSYVLLFYSIIRGLWKTIRVLQIDDYRTFPEPNNLRNIMKDKSTLVYLKSLSKDFAKSVSINENNNNKKSKGLSGSYGFIKSIIVLLCILIMSIMFLKIKGG
jgi:hypothetical protein